MNYLEVLNQLRTNRSIDAASIAVSGDATFMYDNYVEPLLRYDMTAAYTVIVNGYGSDLSSRLLAQGSGWVLDPAVKRFRAAKPQEWGIKALTPYDAFLVLATAYGLVANVNNYKEGNLGCVGRPVNFSTGEYLTSDKTVLNVDMNKIVSGTGYFTTRSEEQANLVGNEIHRANRFVNKIVTELMAATGAKSPKKIHEQAQNLFKKVAPAEALWNLAQHYLALMNPDLAVFVTPRIHDMLDHITPTSNVYVLGDHNYLDYAWSRDEALMISTLLAAAANANSLKSFITVEEYDEEDIVWFEEDYVSIKADGVYDSRDRRFMNALLVKPHTQKVEAKEQDLVLLNSFGSYVMSILNTVWFITNTKATTNIGAQEPIARWYRLFTDVVPMDSEAESGAMDVGQRGDYNRVSTQGYVWRELLPFRLDPFGVNTKNTYKSHGNNNTTKGQFIKFSGAKHNLDHAAFTKYNLVRVHKGNMAFMDASWVVVQGKHIPVEYAKTLIRKMCAVVGKSVKEVLLTFYYNAKDYNENVQEKAIANGLNDEEKLLELFIKFGGVALSTKISKITKRITLATPSYAEPLEGVLRVFIHYDNITGSDVGHRYKGGHFPMLLYVPGVCLLLAEHLKPFIVKTNYQEQLESIDKNTANWKFALGQPTSVGRANSRRQTLSYTHLTTTREDESGVVSCKGISVNKGDLIVSVPYAAGGETYYHDITAEEDGWIQSIVTWTVKIGRQEIVVIRVNYYDIQRNAKIRNTFKALTAHPSTMLEPSNEQLIANTLNNNLDTILGKKLPSDVEVIITGDSDKSKDLLSGLLDIAAETAQGNNDYESIRALNKLLGQGQENYHYIYHELLAMVGEYDRFLANFIDQYGRSAWFLTKDVSNAMIHALSQLYINKSNWVVAPEGKLVVVANLAKDKWLRRSYKELVEYCPEVKDYDFGIDPNSLVIVTSNVTKDGSISQYDEVLVFGEKDGKETDLTDFMWQRSFGFIGDANKGTHIYINAKVELCSVDQSVTSSPLMSAIARCIDVGVAGVEGNHKEALNLMAKVSKESATQFNAIQAMAKGLPMVNAKNEVLEKIDLFTDKGELNPALVAKLSLEEHLEDAKNNKLNLVKIARKARNTVIGLGGERYIYLAAILNQSRRTDMYESLSGLTYVLIRNAMLGSKKAELDNRIERICGAIANLAKSDNLQKAVFMGRKSAQNKTIGCFGLPVNWYISWIDSPVFWSIVDSAVEANLIKSRNDWPQLIGKKILVTRPPLPFPAVLLFMPTLSPAMFAKAKAKYDLTKVSHIQQFFSEEYGIELNDEQANILRYSLKRNYGVLINKSQAGVSALVCYVSGGDHDGDGYTATVADLNSKLPVLTYDTVMRVLLDRTGKEGVGRNMEAYIADHYMPKCWKLSQLTNPSLMKLDNLTLIEKVPSASGIVDDDYDFNAPGVTTFKHSFISDLIGSTLMQLNLVGLTHRIAVTTEIRSGIGAKCYDALVEHDASFENIFKGSVLDALILLALYELYEGGTLGGLSWEGYNACKLLATVLRQDRLVYTQATPHKGSTITDKINNVTYEFEDSLIAASINANHSKLYFDAADNIRRIEDKARASYFYSLAADGSYFIFESNGMEGECVLTHDHIPSYQIVDFAGYAMYKLCGGNFKPEIHKDNKGQIVLNGHAVIAIALYYIPRKVWNVMKKQSVSIFNLDLYLEKVLPVVCPEMVTYGFTQHQSYTAIDPKTKAEVILPYVHVHTGKFLQR